MRDLQVLREAQGLTRGELAEKANITATTVYNVEEQQVQSPQADVRHNIEMALRQRVNWLTTLGFRGGIEQTCWEDAEETLRRNILNVNHLSNTEKKQFITVAREYLKAFEAYITLAETEDSEVLLPMEIYDELRRQRDGN